MEQITQLNIFKKMQSAYLISILLFCSSLIILFMKSFYSNLSVSLVSDMKFSVDRNHMFLICNGILVILVKSSTSNSSQEHNSDNTNRLQNDQPRSTVSSERIHVENSAQVSNVLHHDDQTNDHDDDHHDEDDDDHDDDDEDDGCDEDEDAEELNKRCEDFIRRMKQGIMYESRKDSCLVGFS